MSQFFDETMQGLLEAVAISKGEIPLAEKEPKLDFLSLINIDAPW